MVCLAVLRIFLVVLSTILVRWFCMVNIKLFSAVSMAEFHSALNFGSSFSITRGLIVIAIFAGVLPLPFAGLPGVTWPCPGCLFRSGILTCVRRCTPLKNANSSKIINLRFQKLCAPVFAHGYCNAINSDTSHNLPSA